MENVKKDLKFNLYWIDKETGKQFPAGVAFYHEEKGDYRLKIDAMPDDKLVYLKPTDAKEKDVKYRVDVVLRKNGEFSRKSLIGTGYSGTNTGKFIFMDLGPFSRSLVLDMGA